MSRHPLHRSAPGSGGILPMLLACLMVSAAPAQDLDDLSSLMPGSLTAMKEARWEEALKLLSQATALGQEQALRTYGPQFGVVWYRRGICEMKLRRWEDAIRSFETCYRDYPNRGPSGGNLYQGKALLKWGEAAVGAKKWDLAISRFRKFLEERDKARDAFNPGVFYVTLAICHYKLGEIPKGNEQLEIAIRNRVGFPTSDDQIVAGLQSLVEAAVAAGNEPALVDFISSNRQALVFEPRQALAYTATFLKLSADCAATAMNQAALGLLQFTADPKEVAGQLRSELASAPAATRAGLEAELERIEGAERGAAPIGLLRLSARASALEVLGQTEPACADRERILRDYPEAGEDNLRRLGMSRLSLAEARLSEGKKDEAIALYEKVWMEGGPGPGARAVRRWMELLWERNRGDDRLAACRGGHSYLDLTREQELASTEADREAREEVARLTRVMQAGLTSPATESP